MKNFLPKITVIISFISCIPSMASNNGCGIFVLDQKNGKKNQYRDTHVKAAINQKYVHGYVARHNWDTFEPQKDSYQFEAFNHLIGQLQSERKFRNKKLSLSVTGPSASYFYTDTEYTGEKWEDGRSAFKEYYFAPWEPYVQTRFEKLLKAMSNHKVINKNADNGQEETKLKDHPTLHSLQFGVPGIGRIREYKKKFKDIPGYTRDKFIGSVISALKLQLKYFPNKHHIISIWKIEDGNSGPSLTQELIETIASEFNGTKASKITVIQDNLAANKNDAGVLKGFPVSTKRADFLVDYNKQLDRPTGFQMLTSWTKPWSQDMKNKTKNTSPVDAIKFAQEEFGSNYFEVYANDVNNPKYKEEINEMAKKVCNN